MKTIGAVFARNVRIFREIRGLTQAQLAEKVEISVNFLSLIEGERKFPSPQVVDRFISALDLQTHQLFQESVDPGTIGSEAEARRMAVDFRNGVVDNLHSYVDAFFRQK